MTHPIEASMRNRNILTNTHLSIFTDRFSKNLEDIHEKIEITDAERYLYGGSKANDGKWYTLTRITAKESGELLREYPHRNRLLNSQIDDDAQDVAETHSLGATF